MNESRMVAFNPKEITGKSDLQKVAAKAFELLSSPDLFSTEVNMNILNLYSFTIVSRNNKDIFHVVVGKLEQKLPMSPKEKEYFFSIWRMNDVIGRQEINFEAQKKGEFWDIDVESPTTKDMLQEKKRKQFVDSFLQSQVDTDKTNELSAIFKKTKSFFEGLTFELPKH